MILNRENVFILYLRGRPKTNLLVKYHHILAILVRNIWICYI